MLPTYLSTEHMVNRAYGNEREFKDALKHAKAECYKLEADLGLYIDN